MREQNRRGRPYTRKVQGQIKKILLATGNIKKTRELLNSSPCNLGICYPTLLKFANEIGMKRKRKSVPSTPKTLSLELRKVQGGLILLATNLSSTFNYIGSGTTKKK